MVAEHLWVGRSQQRSFGSGACYLSWWGIQMCWSSEHGARTVYL